MVSRMLQLLVGLSLGVYMIFTTRIQASPATGGPISSVERTINVLRYVFMHVAEEKNITQEQIEAILSNSRTCLEVNISAVKQSALSNVLGVLEQTHECLVVFDSSQPSEATSQQFIDCLKGVPDISTTNLNMVDAAVDSCVRNTSLRLKEIISSVGDD